MPAGVHDYMHPFGGEKVHWTFSLFHLTPLKGRETVSPIGFQRVAITLVTRKHEPNTVAAFSFLFKGEAGRGMGLSK